jgi:hypothetical protein
MDARLAFHGRFPIRGFTSTDGSIRDVVDEVEYIADQPGDLDAAETCMNGLDSQFSLLKQAMVEELFGTSGGDDRY